MKSRTPWVITRDKNLGWECLRCGEKTALTLPVRISVWTAAAKAFVAAHWHCTEGRG